jgi:hypothetical protein
VKFSRVALKDSNATMTKEDNNQDASLMRSRLAEERFGASDAHSKAAFQFTSLLKHSPRKTDCKL